MLEHGSPDVQVLDELFYQRIYAPPAEVDAALAALGRAPRVLDVGANIGLFGAWALSRWPGATIDAFEPEPRNAALHRRTIAAQRPCRRVAPARGGRDGARRRRWASRRPLRHERPGDRAEHGRPRSGAGAATCCPLLASADLVKIDAEGSEWEILDDPRFAGEALRAPSHRVPPGALPGARRAHGRRRAG